MKTIGNVVFFSGGSYQAHRAFETSRPPFPEVWEPMGRRLITRPLAQSPEAVGGDVIVRNGNAVAVRNTVLYWRGEVLPMDGEWFLVFRSSILGQELILAGDTSALRRAEAEFVAS